MAVLTDKESILALSDSPIMAPHEVPLPDGQSVYVRCLSGDELDSVQQWQEANVADMVGYRARIAASGICSASGDGIVFTEDDVRRLGRLPAPMLNRIVSRISELSHLGDSGGNENGPPADDSGSA